MRLNRLPAGFEPRAGHQGLEAPARKTGRPVQFEIMEQTRSAVQD
jgi:hypothetical protein